MEKDGIISTLRCLHQDMSNMNAPVSNIVDRWVRFNTDKSAEEVEKIIRNVYSDALSSAIGLLETSYDMLPVEQVNYSNREEAVESAINFLRMLLSYHQRTSMTTSPNFLATTYERDFLTAIDCLEREKDRLS